MADGGSERSLEWLFIAFVDCNRVLSMMRGLATIYPAWEQFSLGNKQRANSFRDLLDLHKMSGCLCFDIVNTSDVGIIERFGKFSRLAEVSQC